MIAVNPLRMDYYRKYSEIIADYNREKDRVTIEDTFARLVDFASSLSPEERRAAEEGLREDELALFDLLKKDNLSKAERERVKLASRSLLRIAAPADCSAGALDGKRTNPSGSRDVHSRLCLPRTAHAAIYRRRKTDDLKTGVPTHLATKRWRLLHVGDWLSTCVHTPTFNLIPSFGACARSCFVPRYRSVVSSSPPAARRSFAVVRCKSCGAIFGRPASATYVFSICQTTLSLIRSPQT
jgi:hypothetical protein